MTTDSSASDMSSTRVCRDYYTALSQVALTISSSLELHHVLHNVVKSTAEAMNVKACGLRLLNSDTGQLTERAAYGLSKNYLAKGAVLVGLSPIDKDTLQGTPVYIPDVRADPRFQYQDAARQEGLVSVLCVPLQVHDENIGVMRVYTDKPTTFHQDDVQFLTVLAHLAALAIENARLYESLKSSYTGIVDAFWGVNVISE